MAEMQNATEDIEQIGREFNFLLETAVIAQKLLLDVPDMSVAELQQQLRQNMGLFPQIQRVQATGAMAVDF
jgi:hypothetical protein